MKNIPRPSFFLYLTEAIRAIFDIGRGLVFRLTHQIKSVDSNAPVLVVPGFLGSDFSTAFLRKFITDLGFPTYGWGLGRNLGDLNELAILVEKLEAIQAKHQQKVTLIGWSLGGVYVREMAKQKPELVRQVITMGSPFRDIEAPNHARWIYDLIGKKGLDAKFLATIPLPAPVSTLAIYTKQDGVVAWKTCMEEQDMQHRNLKVWGSHTGLVFNPLVCEAIEKELLKNDTSKDFSLMT
ncbi:MAG: alpha/beta hydrolase [Spirosomataceae bacterium]